MHSGCRGKFPGYGAYVRILRERTCAVRVAKVALYLREGVLSYPGKLFFPDVNSARACARGIASFPALRESLCGNLRSPDRFARSFNWSVFIIREHVAVTGIIKIKLARLVIH